jgi:hypothetical protein
MKSSIIKLFALFGVVGALSLFLGSQASQTMSYIDAYTSTTTIAYDSTKFILDKHKTKVLGEFTNGDNTQQACNWSACLLYTLKDYSETEGVYKGTFSVILLNAKTGSVFVNKTPLSLNLYTSSTDLDYSLNPGQVYKFDFYSFYTATANGTAQVSLSVTAPQSVSKLPINIVKCEYPAAPDKCSYVPGTDYNSITDCGRQLSCSTSYKTPTPTPTAKTPTPTAVITPVVTPTQKIAITPIPLPTSLSSQGYKIIVSAYGTPAFGDYPIMQLSADNKVLSSWRVGSKLEEYVFSSAVNYSGQKLKVSFVNDAYNPPTEDRNLFVESVNVGGVVIYTKDSSVYSNGGWGGDGCAAGFKMTSALYCDGYFEFKISGGSLSSSNQVTTNADNTIKSKIDGIDFSVSTSARYGSAINSLIYNGKEFVDNYDHGRQIQSSIRFDGYGECNNPTEAGSHNDFNGAISSSQIINSWVNEAQIFASSFMANWLKPGQSSPYCLNGKAGSAINSSVVSNVRLDKTISINSKNIPGVIEYNAKFIVPDYHKVISINAPDVYLTKDFSSMYYYVYQTNSLIKRGYNRGLLPPIFATADGKYALAMYSPQVLPENNADYLIDYLPSWQLGVGYCGFYEFNVEPKTINRSCFIIVGSLDGVKTSLRSLMDTYQSPIKSLSLPFGYFDNLDDKGTVSGWAVDPDNEKQNLKIEFRLDSPNGTKLGTVTASNSDDDLKSITGSLGKYFYGQLSLPKDGQTHTVIAYAVDTQDQNIKMIIGVQVYK